MTRSQRPSDRIVSRKFNSSFTYEDILDQIEEHRENTRIRKEFYRQFHLCIVLHDEECLRIFLESPFSNELVKQSITRWEGVGPTTREFDQPILFDAIEQGHPGVVRLLLEHGADATAKNGLDMTAIEYAYTCKGDQIGIVAVLKEYGAEK